MDSRMPNGRWMTYAALAELWDISPDSARLKANTTVALRLFVGNSHSFRTRSVRIYLGKVPESAAYRVEWCTHTYPLNGKCNCSIRKAARQIPVWRAGPTPIGPACTISGTPAAPAPRWPG